MIINCSFSYHKVIVESKTFPKVCISSYSHTFSLSGPTCNSVFSSLILGENDRKRKEKKKNRYFPAENNCSISYGKKLRYFIVHSGNLDSSTNKSSKPTDWWFVKSCYKDYALKPNKHHLWGDFICVINSYLDRSSAGWHSN